MFLESHFVGSTTGETFNKSGKTDILLRYEKTNVFVAECKFWSGTKGYYDALSQLLGYLTWRDSKTALVLFVDNKQFTRVLDAVNTETARHPNYLKAISSDPSHGTFEYRFHLPGDDQREIWLTVLLFHFPKAA